jgi:HNH endonuclease
MSSVGVYVRSAHGFHDPDIPHQIDSDVGAAFWRLVDRTGPGCWPWLGHIDRRGVARFHLGRHLSLRAARVAYALAYGPPPTGVPIRHTCLNHACCRPAHLYRGEV